jgi:mitochondrial translocator assembly and maintenance protein 41
MGAGTARNSQANLGMLLFAWFQNELGAKLWFNTLVPATVTVHGSPHDATFKYGVISTRCLVDDLLQWRTLYLAGRLHKPVDILTAPTDLQPHLRTNLRHALSASLLMLPNTFSVQLLFEVSTPLDFLAFRV